jgi:glycosyltransferase involved in cell wall biosynthesis
MPKIVRIIARLNIGGPAIHTVLTTAGLEPMGFETTLVTGQPGPTEGDMSYFAYEHGVDPMVIEELGRAISPFDDLRAFARLVAFLRRERPDIVHTHTAKAGTLGRLAAIIARVPVRVHTFHGHVFDGYFSPWQTKAFLLIERTLARFTDRILTLSDGQRRDLSGRYQIASEDRIDVVPLGLDLEPLAHCDAKAGQLRRELGTDAPLVGIVGRMVPIKNHELFFRAAALVPNAHFVVVGGGEREAELRALVSELRLDDRTHFIGWRRDLDVIYADLDVVALTSKNEGTPVALIEAMAAGVPVVATAVGGVPDLLRNGQRGELVGAPFEPHSVAAAVGRALQPAAVERAAALRAQIVEDFGASRLCRDLEVLYSRLLKERAS